MDLWNFKIDWYLDSGYTWEKVNRLNVYSDDETIDNLDDVYFKYQKCISGITYQYVLDLYDIYKRNIMVGSPDYTKLLYTEQDIINEFMDNFKNVDFYITDNIDTTEQIIKLNNKYVKASHRIILTSQTDKTENGIYSFDNNGLLTKTNDLDLSGTTSGTTFRYGVFIKLDNNTNVEYFLVNSGNTFPTSDDEKDFMTGHTFIIKHGFHYDINNTGTTYDSIPKLWFTDYDFARKMNEENASLCYGPDNVSAPSSTITIQYQTNPLVTFDIGSFSTYSSGTVIYNQYSGKTHLTVGSSYASEVDTGDYLDISMRKTWSGNTYSAFFKSIVYDSNGSDLIILDEYIPDYVISGMTGIDITNINKLSAGDWASSIDLLNSHYYGEFIYFSGTTFPLNVTPKESQYSKYINYDEFRMTFDATSYDPLFRSFNHYINYNLYTHLNSIESGTFDTSFDLGSGFTMTSFTQEATYLLDDSDYPQQTSDAYSPLKITPTSSSDLDYFYKYTCVYIDGDYDNKVFVLDKDDESITIERPIPLAVAGTITSVTSFYTLSGISEVLYDLYLNTGVTYYEKESEFRSRSYKEYNNLLCRDERIRKYTTGTITPDLENKYNLKLFNYRNSANVLLSGNTIGDVYYDNDINLLFTPLEIVDIGTDKQTKMPIRIYKSEDMIINDTILSGYTVDIVKDNIETNITLVNGMTIEKLKLKYIWIYNAIIEDAIIGEDDYGLVWYTGNWICGEWVNGTWYNGNWYDGTWKNGRWYSWLIDKYAILVNDKLKKLDDNKKYSKFVNGEWRNGEWYNGIFGDDISITGYTSKVFLNHTDVLPDLKVATWKNGNFHTGEFKNSIWENGNFLSGDMYGGYWKNGTFSKGTFNGNWWNGNFHGGDFEYGIWEDGLFTSAGNAARFGYNTLTCSATTTEWWNGTMNGAELYAGTYEPINYNRTHWYNGTFRNSKWYGGHLFTGLFINSWFYNGVFGTYDVDVLANNPNMIFESGNFMNGLWLDGTFIDGNFRNGVWLSGNFEGGNMRTLSPERKAIPIPKATTSAVRIEQKRAIL